VTPSFPTSLNVAYPLRFLLAIEPLVTVPVGSLSKFCFFSSSVLTYNQWQAYPFFGGVEVLLQYVFNLRLVHLTRGASSLPF